MKRLRIKKSNLWRRDIYDSRKNTELLLRLSMLLRASGRYREACYWQDVGMVGLMTIAMRESGYTLEQIGDVLSMTKQAASKRLQSLRLNAVSKEVSWPPIDLV